MKSIIYSFLILFFASSCATILTPHYQDIVIKTNDKSAKVFIDDSLVGSGEHLTAKVKRDGSIKEIKICTDSHEDKIEAIPQAFRPVTFALSIVPFGLLMGLPPVLDVGKRAYNYPYIVNIESYHVKYKKPENSYSIDNSSVQFNLSSKDIITKYAKYRVYHRKNGDISSIEDFHSKSAEKYLNEDLWKFSLDCVLINKQYINPNKEIFKSNIHLKVVVDSLEHDCINAIGSRDVNLFKANTEWIVTNQYSEILYTKKIWVKSDVCAESYYYNENNPFQDPAFRQVSQSLFNAGLSILHQDPKFLEAIRIKEEKIFDQPYIISQKKVAQSIEEVVDATVIIKTDVGHGSGFYIGEKGEIVTNYHVVGEADSVKVIKNDGTVVIGKVIRKSQKYDLALIQTSEIQNVVVPVKKNKEWEFGDEIFIVGTPLSTDLSQTVMNGVISGERKKDGVSLIQTDASLNAGISGGPMVDVDGHLIGVVSSKISGSNIEGIGFAIYVNSLVEGINLKIE